LFILKLVSIIAPHIVVTLLLSHFIPRESHSIHPHPYTQVAQTIHTRFYPQRLGGARPTLRWRTAAHGVERAQELFDGALRATCCVTYPVGGCVTKRFLISTVGVAKVNFFNVVHHTIRIHVLLTCRNRARSCPAAAPARTLAQEALHTSCGWRQARPRGPPSRQP
jgi:hypothetical protein